MVEIGPEGGGSFEPSSLERVSVGDSFVADEGCGEGEERGEVSGGAFVSVVQAAVAEQPCDGAFDFPSVSSEALAGVDAALSQHGT